jgi:DNA repair exonuclease SbcCD ATPase subunit
MFEYWQFAALDLAFPEVGVVGLVGRNGSGKSTVLEAIRFVLFGAEACRTTKDQLARTGSDGAP